jgi:hypothetical protein
VAEGVLGAGYIIFARLHSLDVDKRRSPVGGLAGERSIPSWPAPYSFLKLRWLVHLSLLATLTCRHGPSNAILYGKFLNKYQNQQANLWFWLFRQHLCEIFFWDQPLRQPQVTHTIRSAGGLAFLIDVGKSIYRHPDIREVALANAVRFTGLWRALPI